MAKVKIEKNWFLKAEPPKDRRIVALFDQVAITKSEHLPELVCTKRAAVLLGVKEGTARDFMKQKIVQAMKLRGRWYTTPQWIADYMAREMKAHG